MTCLCTSCLRSAGNTYFTYVDDRRATDPMAGGLWGNPDPSNYSFASYTPPPNCSYPVVWPLGLTGGGFPPYVANVMAQYGGGIFTGAEQRIYTTFSVSEIS